MPREKDIAPDDLGPPWTIRKLLRWTTGYFERQEVTETPRLDADLLLGHILEMERVELYARSKETVDETPRTSFRELVRRRAEGEPVAYLIGHKSFWQMELQTDDRALIPRPETEVLVEATLDVMGDDPGRLVDIGTGTGAIVAALVEEHPEWTFAATDLEEDALALAERNLESLGWGESVELYRGDLFDALPDRWNPLDVIVSNPPYVPESDRDRVMVDVRDYEPESALFAGEEGLDIIEPLVDEAPAWLVEGGYLLIEIAHHQSDRVRDLLESSGFSEVEIRRDYSDHDRVAIGRL